MHCDAQVVAYALARPAREVLFTVTSREEKYKAKVALDTLVVRGGDALSAGMFHVLEGVLHLGGLRALAPLLLGVDPLLGAFLLGQRRVDNLCGKDWAWPTQHYMQCWGRWTSVIIICHMP